MTTTTTAPPVQSDFVERVRRLLDGDPVTGFTPAEWGTLASVIEATDYADDLEPDHQRIIIVRELEELLANSGGHVVEPVGVDRPLDPTAIAAINLRASNWGASCPMPIAPPAPVHQVVDVTLTSDDRARIFLADGVHIAGNILTLFSIAPAVDEFANELVDIEIPVWANYTLREIGTDEWRCELTHHTWTGRGRLVDAQERRIVLGGAIVVSTVAIFSLEEAGR